MSNSKVKNFKKVLMISNNPVTPYSAQGASRGSWFRDWDKDSLAMMTFAKAGKDNDFANHSFHVTIEERAGGGLLKIFFKKRTSAAGNTGGSKKEDSIKESFKHRILRILKLVFGLISSPRYSKRLKRFMEDFNPDIIFSTVADCYGARLAKFLSKKAKIPYIIQQEDNWLVSDVVSNVFKKQIAAIRKNCLKNSLKKAEKRYVICPSMKEYFHDLFDMEFESLFCADEPERFIEPVKHNPEEKTVFAYIGNSRPKRSYGFIRIAEAIKNTEIINPELRIYSTNAYKEDVAKLNEFGFVKFFDVPHHNDVPKALSKANVLIHTESFDEDIVEYSRLALSSKSQIYMMAKVPILIFSHPLTGVMDYALKTGFAVTVIEDDLDKLEQAVGSIVNDKKLRTSMVKKAYDVAIKNHNACDIRDELKQTIEEICDNY